MSHNHYIGGKTKQAVERPPVKDLKATIICVCKRQYVLNRAVNVELTCLHCGAVLRYRPGMGVTVETVEAE